MRIALIGYGRMGKMVRECIAQRDDLAVAGIVDFGHLASLSEVDAPDVAIDFSYPGDLPGLLDAALARRIPLVIGRTGVEEAHAARIRAASGDLPIVWSSNFSPGVTVLQRVAREMAYALGEGYDIEIVETHHKQKLDAPSGTVRMLLSAIDPKGARPVIYGREGAMEKRGGEIGVHALRGGRVLGEHSVHFYGEMEELTLSHRADDRRVFASGALMAASFVVTQPPGLYTMEQVLFAEAAG